MQTTRWRGALLLAATVVFLAGASGPARAQDAAGAADRELLRQQERERALREQLERSPDVRLPRPTGAATTPVEASQDLPCFPIARVVLQGDDAGHFQFAVQALRQRLARSDTADGPAPECLGALGIEAALRDAQNALIERGYITTRVLAQPQDLKSGTLTLTIIPGRVRRILLDDASDPRATLRNALPLRAGQHLNLRDIEQGLENLKRVPTAEADIRIAPGEKPGESDLLVRWTQGFPWRVALSLDDSGSKTTGKYQGSMTLSYDHWWTLNDLFYVSLNRDLGGGEPGKRGTRGHTAHYSLPHGYWLLGLTASAYDYHQAVAGASQTYVYSGSSANAELKLSRLLHRDATRKTSASVKALARKSRNYIDDTEVEVQRRRTGGWEASISHRAFVGRGSVDASLAYRRGTGAFSAIAAPEEAFGEGSSRSKIVVADIGVTLPAAIDTPWGRQPLRDGGAWRAQWNRTPLVPQDRFSIGGRHSVRGFDGESSLVAERGWLWRNELAFALGASSHEAYVGVDHGELGGPSAERLVGTRLTGAVLGLRGARLGLGYEVFAGWPLRRPSGFETSGTTAGFSLNWTH
jgi:hemolysin activation/secretion protein